MEMIHVATKPKKLGEYKEIVYNSAHWKLLGKIREKATFIMTALEGFRLHTLVHGSIARGDVNMKSDIDVFVTDPRSSFLVETALERANIPVNARLLIQATPNYAMKAYIEVDARTSLSFPLMHMRRVERELYKFGGEVNLNKLKTDARVAGVDKRLMLIEPTVKGHIESNIVGHEEAAAKLLGISVETVRNRVHALLRRDKVGRTGVFKRLKILLMRIQQYEEE
jgi:predicted nucleotidyltransferase